MSTVRGTRGSLKNRKASLVADQRGAVSFEMIIVFAFLMFGLLMPLADLAIVGFQYISAWSALRSFGQYIQYNHPPDPTNPATWSNGLQKTVGGYTIGNIQVMCGDATSVSVCTSGNINKGTPPTQVPADKYFTFSTTVTLAPMVLRSVLCRSTCTYTLPYSQRFQ